MTRGDIINNALKQFEIPLIYYKAVPYLAKSNKTYLLLGEPYEFKGSLETDGHFDKKSFGIVKGNNARLSCSIKLELGYVIKYNEKLFVVSYEIKVNKSFDTYHYNLLAVQDYYKNCVIDSLDKEISDIALNSSTLLLNLDYDIPIIPSALIPNDNINKYITFNILESKSESMPLKENENIFQYKKDMINFYAVNLSADECQEFLYFLVSCDRFGYRGIPYFTLANDAFVEYLNMQTSVYVCTFYINYLLKTNILKPLDNKLISKVEFQLNLLRGDKHVN